MCRIVVAMALFEDAASLRRLTLGRLRAMMNARRKGNLAVVTCLLASLCVLAGLDTTPSAWVAEPVVPAKSPKNKSILVLIELLGLGFFGLDRFYMECWVSGVAKLWVNFHFVGLWWLVDFVGVVANGARQKDNIDFLGMTGTFETAGVSTATNILAVAGALAIVGIASEMFKGIRAGKEARRRGCGRCFDCITKIEV
eukprot:TRINITY_DN43302_c0_g1_i1.p1 TRINITY_DN43302_c0_g1~~TRINITY_DN43302_c0_g1_i1.p1  ORF type:complete len:198 (-),score=33.73 TRINITY_DN43302_c0_g1_i1:114-707(-)